MCVWDNLQTRVIRRSRLDPVLTRPWVELKETKVDNSIVTTQFKVDNSIVTTQFFDQYILEAKLGAVFTCPQGDREAYEQARIRAKKELAWLIYSEDAIPIIEEIEKLARSIQFDGDPRLIHKFDIPPAHHRIQNACQRLRDLFENGSEGCDECARTA